MIVPQDTHTQLELKRSFFRSIYRYLLYWGQGQDLPYMSWLGIEDYHGNQVKLTLARLDVRKVHFS